MPQSFSDANISVLTGYELSLRKKNPVNDFISAKERIILGIDPGTIVMGYGIIRIVGNKPRMETLGVLQLDKYENHYLRLSKIFERVTGLIDEYHPNELAIEAPFFGKNVQSMLKLGRAQGVAISAALNRGIPIFEYAPLKIKMSITGNGNASKEQVAGMLQRFLRIPSENMLPQMDATDGLAAAVCHFFQTNNPVAEKKYTGWKDYISKNKKK
jgi:crossover junction endodeoxyribonuclease RuvC